MFTKIGKVFLVKPQVLSPEELSFFRDLCFENFIFFREHFSESFKDYLSKLSRYLKFLKLLAVDQEGGRVCRIEGDFDSPHEIAIEVRKKGPKIAYSWAEKIAKTLGDYSLNLNLAPVVDLGDEETESFIKYRTFSKDPKVVAELAKVFIEIHKKWNIYTTLKHFPGLRDVKVDPHQDLPYKNRVSNEDLYPFEVLSDQADFIMTTHLVITEWDKKPVTLSEVAINFLRKKLNFRKAIVTDDLSMGALKSFELPERIVYALASGHNLLIYCGQIEELVKALELLKPEIEKSQILREKLGESLTILERYRTLKN